MRKKPKVLFDKRGGRINLSGGHVNKDFRLIQPKLRKGVDYLGRIIRLDRCLDVYAEITAEQFKTETKRLLALIRENPKIANIANGVWLPVVLPQLTTDDLGETVEQYLEAVGKSYVKTFGDRKFNNYRKDTLAGEVRIIDGSRHDQLIAKMKKGSVMGIHFPNPLQGFSINASREQISILPEGFILSGMDTLIAMTMYPDILARDRNTPGLSLAAFSWQSASCSLYFWEGRDLLDFGSTDVLADARDFFSSGLFFCG